MTVRGPHVKCVALGKQVAHPGKVGCPLVEPGVVRAAGEFRAQLHALQLSVDTRCPVEVVVHLCPALPGRSARAPPRATDAASAAQRGVGIIKQDAVARGIYTVLSRPREPGAGRVVDAVCLAQVCAVCLADGGADLVLSVPGGAFEKTARIQLTTPCLGHQGKKREELGQHCE